MKKKNQIRAMALVVVLGLMASGCTKENVDEIGVVATANSAIYIVDGQHYYANPQTEEEWSAFYERMVALAEEGYTVHFWRNGVQTSCTKEKVTFTTTSHAEAVAWCKQKADEGYNVTMTYNQQTGKYTCIAIR